jgi:O-antigen/teichoic acid export membrane protein
MAFKGAGVWALVFNSVATIFFAMPLFFKATGWKPAFVMEKQAFKDVFGFGVYTTGSNIMSYLYNNIDYLLIGKLLGATPLGIYSLAFVLTDSFRSRLMAVINNVMYPIYGKKQSDFISIRKYYLKVVEFNCLFIFPVMIFFIMEGNSFVVHVFGSKWQGTVVPLQILSFSVILHILVSGNTALLRGLGRPGLEMKQQVLKAVIFLPSLAIGIYYGGIIGAAWAILLNKLIGLFIAQYTFIYLIPIKISTKEFVIAIKAPLIAAACAFLIAYLLTFINVNYLIAGALICTCYCCVIWLFMQNELKVLIKSIIRK